MKPSQKLRYRLHWLFIGESAKIPYWNITVTRLSKRRYKVFEDGIERQIRGTWKDVYDDLIMLFE